VPDATFSDLAFFAQDEWQATPWLRLVGGLRVDRFRVASDRTTDFVLPPFFTPDVVDALGLAGLESGLSVTDTAVSGDVGVVVKPVESVSLVARVGRSFREPNLFERFFTDFGSVGGFVVGNPSLEPETGVNVDAGVKVHTRRFVGSFTYFKNTYSDFLTSRPALDRSGAPVGIPTGPGQPPIPVFQTVNAARVRIHGVEADFELRIPVGASFLTPFGNLTALRGDDLERDVPLDFITPFKAFGGLRWQDGPERYWAEYSFRAVTGQDRLSPAYLATNGGAEPGFVSHDVRGGVNFRFERCSVGFSAGVTNVGDRYFSEQFTLAPARGRSATIGLNLRFH
jgi:hemoglobin/transferrin/lactoferrin receptor protein